MELYNIDHQRKQCLALIDTDDALQVDSDARALIPRQSDCAGRRAGMGNAAYYSIWAAAQQAWGSPSPSFVS